jgi:chromosome segregation protein
MMTLKSIEVSSFKSFGKKSSISFLTPITAIVGPNGSGKSNIVESMRFVLGEQSMKSLRGKGGVDLIFKGSKTLSSANRASVYITFDNSKKIFSFTNSISGISLDYDEIIIGREVFADGVNKYSINGTEVRLKDIVDLLASVNIGSSGHHIISQGEADRILNASSKDRRLMIEDALGLKVYQYRIRESERKLEKTFLNIKEIESLKREIAPHLSFLKKQVQVVEKAREMKDDLKDLYRTYISSESKYIREESKRIAVLREEFQSKGSILDSKINELQNVRIASKEESPYEKDLRFYEESLFKIRKDKDELTRQIGRIEGILEGLERSLSKTPEKKESLIPFRDFSNFSFEIDESINKIIEENDIFNIKESLKVLKSKFKNFISLYESEDIENTNISEHKEYQDLLETKNNLNHKIEDIKSEESKILNIVNGLKINIQEERNSILDSERSLYELMREKNEIVSSLHSLGFEEENLSHIKNSFETELNEGAILVGREILDFTNINIESEVSRTNQEDLRKKIERIKIKIEDIGANSGVDIMKEYQDTKERDEFLSKELDDLNTSINSLKILIQELKEKLDNEFKGGVEKINKQFQEFFSLMFGGGGAFLSITMEHKKTRKAEEELDEENENNEEDSQEIGFERGIEINVSLPEKKVKDLNMLSGGERSLTSIALLFAISQVNPPPFLVLDETDAALDESNSRKYGNMLENLSKYSQLIVVTHNRETMSRAKVLYGVTMGQEGVSKLLSIHLEDATNYAK